MFDTRNNELLIHTPPGERDMIVHQALLPSGDVRFPYHANLVIFCNWLNVFPGFDDEDELTIYSMSSPANIYSQTLKAKSDDYPEQDVTEASVGSEMAFFIDDAFFQAAIAVSGTHLHNFHVNDVNIEIGVLFKNVLNSEIELMMSKIAAAFRQRFNVRNVYHCVKTQTFSTD